jgi:GNAT superfamily N-acetyltransferase
MDPHWRMADRLLVRRADELTPVQLDRVKQIYAQAFPPELRVPFAELAVATPADLTLVAVDETEPVGFATSMVLGDSGWTFLRYYAVTTARRRAGIGRAFWAQALPAMAAWGCPRRVVFEVEDPAEPECEPGEREVREGRIAFWQRCGARLLDVAGYVMPDLTGFSEPEPMRLMACYDADSGPLPPTQVAGLVTALYSWRYGLSPDHPLVADALASIGR